MHASSRKIVVILDGWIIAWPKKGIWHQFLSWLTFYISSIGYLIWISSMLDFPWNFMKLLHPIVWSYMIWFIFNLGWNIPQLASTFPSLQPLNRRLFKLSQRMCQPFLRKIWLEMDQSSLGPIFTWTNLHKWINDNSKMKQNGPIFRSSHCKPPKRWIVKRRWFHPSLWFTLWQFNHRVNFRGVRTKLTRLDYLINHF